MPKRKQSAKKPALYSKPICPPADDSLIGSQIPTAHFELREDGSIHSIESKRASHSPSSAALAKEDAPSIPRLIFQDPARHIWLYHGDCLTLLDAIAAKYPEGRFDAIFADPPYFLSNGGITCHAGRMVKVDKGDWDKSRGAEINHEFNLEWLRRCQRVLKPNGTIWVTGTHHVIFSIGYAMQQLGYKILNDIAWEKPNPPPNLSCRYFTHSTETVLWAAKGRESRHIFHYQAMRQLAGGKQMKTVWRISAPSNAEKVCGKHPTQKPIALIERCLLASTSEGDLILDPFLGGGTTAVVAVKLKRACIGIELDLGHLNLACQRTSREIVEVLLRPFRVRIDVAVHGASALQQIDLDLFTETINRSAVDEKSKMEVPTERIFHETKFVFLSCAEVERGSVVHTTVDVSLQEAWAKTPTGKKRETTHVVRCETEIFRIKS